MWTAPTRQDLDGNRHHFSHGPIDLVIEVDGDPAAAGRALDLAWDRFATVLPELAAELPALRRPCDPAMVFERPVARRMQAAVLPFSRDAFVTPMAASPGPSPTRSARSSMRGPVRTHPRQQWRRHRPAAGDGPDPADRPRARPRGQGRPVPAHGPHRPARRRRHRRRCHLRTPRPVVLARHCRCGHRACARCRECRCGGHPDRQCRRPEVAQDYAGARRYSRSGFRPRQPPRDGRGCALVGRRDFESP